MIFSVYDIIRKIAMVDSMTFKEWRLSKGVSQAKIAAELSSYLAKPVKQAHVHRWESGSIPRLPLRDVIRKLSGGIVVWF